jgi:AcrR family transcriptional regulator
MNSGAPERPARKRTRRTQEERSAATQDALLRATIDAMAEVGFARLTLNDIASRAGVSRGALMHHFPNKEDLIVLSYKLLLSEATEEIRSWLDKGRAGEMTLEDFLDRLWVMYSGTLIFVTVEHITEARHNEPLRQRFIPIVKEFHTALDACWSEFFKTTNASGVDPTTVLTATTCLFRGLSLQQVLREDKVYFEKLVDHWKSHVLSLVEIGSNAREHA